MPFLDDDIVDLRRDDGSTGQFYWGDEVELINTDEAHRRVRVIGRNGPVDGGLIAKKAKLRDTPLLRMSMIDVQQGDGLIFETPSGKVIFIDGGDNQLFARHAAARFRGTTAANPLIVDLMLVTHGDADHFDGLNDIRRSETQQEARKRLFVAPLRYYHNGLVKRPGKTSAGARRPERDMLGPVTKTGEGTFIIDLVDDPAGVPPADRNKPFNDWCETLAEWDKRTLKETGASILRRRLDQHATDAFDFLHADGIDVEILGPIVEDFGGGQGLRFLNAPPDDVNIISGTSAAGKGELSASHTINGHSVTFRLKYGNIRFLLTGDLNQESSQRLRTALPGAKIACDILKAPHHGSADFDLDFLGKAAPVVSLISSGDESEAKEYIHPRATLVAALGKASRTMPAIIFITELAAFFKVLGYVTDNIRGRVFAFERTNFGIAHIRTDGERVLAFTHSGKEGMNEAYRFTVDKNGKAVFEPRVSKVSAPKA